MDPKKTALIEQIVDARISKFANSFAERHIADLNAGRGPLLAKKNNDFIYALGADFAVDSAFSRSFDSALGKMLETLGQQLASMFYQGKNGIDSVIYQDQVDLINKLLLEYDSKTCSPEIKDYSKFVSNGINAMPMHHATDNCFYDVKTGIWHIIEVKFGCDLDIKKAKVEKLELLKQYFLMKNFIAKTGGKDKVQIHLAAAYNSQGEGNKWKNDRVLRYFSRDEMLIGSKYWNLVCKNSDAYSVIQNAYKRNVELIAAARKKILEEYNAIVQSA